MTQKERKHATDYANITQSMDSQQATSATQGSVCSASANSFCSTSVEISTPRRQNNHFPENRSNSTVFGAAGIYGKKALLGDLDQLVPSDCTGGSGKLP